MTHVIRKDQKGGAKGYEAPMRKHTVDHRAHNMLADPIMDIASSRIFSSEGFHDLLVLSRRLEVRRTAEKLGDDLREGTGNLTCSANASLFQLIFDSRLLEFEQT